MSHGQAGLVELLVVLASVGGWGAFELVTLRRDRPGMARSALDTPTIGAAAGTAADAAADTSKDAPRHPEG